MTWILLDDDDALDDFEAACLRRFLVERPAVVAEWEHMPDRALPVGYVAAGRPAPPNSFDLCWKDEIGWHFGWTQSAGYEAYAIDEGGALVRVVTEGRHAHIPRWAGEAIAVASTPRTRRIQAAEIVPTSAVAARPARDRYRLKFEEVQAGRARPLGALGDRVSGAGRGGRRR